jgi:hypothetical protein
MYDWGGMCLVIVSPNVCWSVRTVPPYSPPENCKHGRDEVFWRYAVRTPENPAPREASGQWRRKGWALAAFKYRWGTTPTGHPSQLC